MEYHKEERAGLVLLFYFGTSVHEELSSIHKMKDSVECPLPYTQ